MTDGVCINCDTALTERKAYGHLKKCTLGKPGRKHKRFILHIRDLPYKEYWIYVKVDAAATLVDLDFFLRDIWLYCCGHLSQYIINGINYLQPEDAIEIFRFRYQWEDIDTPVRDIFYKGLKFTYEYDFGTPTTLALTVRDEYLDDIPMSGPVELLARNNKPEYACTICGGIADIVYGIHESIERFYCNRCGDKQKEVDLELCLPLLNSPRSGECGFGT